MMRSLLSLAFALIVVVPSTADRKMDPHSARFGDLIITVSGMSNAEAEPHKGDRHGVALFASAKNIGKSAVCMSFRATLKATYGLTYLDVGIGGGPVSMKRYPPAPRISEMLPGEKSTGSYAFWVKDGVQPLALTLRPQRKTLHCGSSDPSWKEALLPEELRFDIHDLPDPEKEQPAQPQQPTPPKL